MNAPLEPALAAFRTPRARRVALTAAGKRVLVEVFNRNAKLRGYVRRTLIKNGQHALMDPVDDIFEQHYENARRELYDLFTAALEDESGAAREKS